MEDTFFILFPSTHVIKYINRFFNIESLVFYKNISLASEDFDYNARFDLSILTFNNLSLYPC